MQIQINPLHQSRTFIPFVDALEQMASYVKFMKDILLRKKRLSDFMAMNLTKESSAFLQKETTT